MSHLGTHPSIGVNSVFSHDYTCVLLFLFLFSRMSHKWCYVLTTVGTKSVRVISSDVDFDYLAEMQVLGLCFV